MGRPVTLQRVAWTTALWLGVASCSAEPSRAPTSAVERAAAPDEMGEPHDQSAFAKNPSQTHLMSPDEPDLHPPSEPDPPERC